MLKLLYINATAELSGADLDLLATVRALDKTCFTPTVLLPHHGPLDAEYTALGVPVFYRNLGIIKRSAARSRQILTVVVLPLIIFKLWRFIRQEQFDLVCSNSMLTLAGGLAARLAGKKTIWRSGELYSRPWWLRYGLYSFVGLIGQRIIASSEAVRQLFPAWARSRVIVVYPGVDLLRFNPDDPATQQTAFALRQEFGIASTQPVVGFVGRIIPWKGVKEFVEACIAADEFLDRAHYIVVGSYLTTYAAYFEEIKALVARSKLVDRFHFALNRQDVPAFLATFDLFVHASIRPEPFGIVIIEALAMGRAAIVSAAGGVPEIFENVPAAILLAPGDVSALSETIWDLLNDPQRRQLLGNAARELVLERFDIEQVVDRQESIYLELFSKPSARLELQTELPKRTPLLDLSVVLVNYNGEKHIVAGLQALRLGLEDFCAEVFIVDNASTDASLGVIRGWLDSLPLSEQTNYHLIENRHNRGYARANNQALCQSQGEFVLLLNPDVKVEPDAIRSILDFLREHPRVGICGPCVRLPDGRLDAPCRRSFKTPAIYFYKFLGLSKLFPHNLHFGKYYLSYLDEHQTTEVDAVIGAFLIIRHEVIAEIGLLDESYFAYCEDEDWCFQAKKRGWQVFYYPPAVVHHLKGASTRQRKLRMVWEWHRSVFKFHYKNLALHYSWPVNLLVYAGIGLHLVLKLTLTLGGYLFGLFRTPGTDLE